MIVVFFAGWLALLALLGLSIGLAYLPLGAVNGFLPLGIAVVQALILMTVFMKLSRGPSLKWVFAAAGFFWLMILLGISSADYITRAGFPSQVPIEYSPG